MRTILASLFFASVAHASAGPFDCAQSFDTRACLAAEAYSETLAMLREHPANVRALESVLMDLCEQAGYDVYECEGDWNAAAEYHYTAEGR